MVQDIEGAVITGDANVDIKQIEYDSRLIKPGGLFVAVKGYRRDGYDFVEAARAAGAVAVMGEREACPLVEHHVRVPEVRRALATAAARFYGFPGTKIKACGVTGTNGKTTVCYLLRRILEARDKVTGLICSQEYYTGKQTFPAERTTPESLDVQRLLFLMKSNFCVNAVIEASSHALVLHRLDHVNFRVAVYTNLTRDHLDFHKSMEEYYEAKASLARRLDGPLSYAVINLDVEAFRPLFAEVDCEFISYSLTNTSADVHCGDFELRPDGTTFDLVTPMGTRTVELHLPGRFNLQNAVAAAAGGLACGVDIDNVVKGLEKATAVPGRLNSVDCGQPFAVYVDFAHTPDAIDRLCETVRELTEGRLLLLFGCGGDRDKGKRPLMGAAAMKGADYVVVTSDNPRTERPEAIIDDVRPGLSGDNYEIEPDRRAAIAAILRKASAGDAVLLAGKGAEKYEEINGQKRPFSDIDEATAQLRAMGFDQPEGTEET